MAQPRSPLDIASLAGSVRVSYLQLTDESQERVTMRESASATVAASSRHAGRPSLPIYEDGGHRWGHRREVW